MGTSWEAFSLKFSFHLRVFLEMYFALKLSLIRFQNRIYVNDPAGVRGANVIISRHFASIMKGCDVINLKFKYFSEDFVS